MIQTKYNLSTISIQCVDKVTSVGFNIHMSLARLLAAAPSGRIPSGGNRSPAGHGDVG